MPTLDKPTSVCKSPLSQLSPNQELVYFMQNTFEKKKTILAFIIALSLAWNFSISAGQLGAILEVFHSRLYQSNSNEIFPQKQPLHSIHGANNSTIRIPQQSVPLPTPLTASYAETGWWTPFLTETARVFHAPYSNTNTTDKYSWCIPIKQSEFPILPQEQSPVQGLLYVKSHKASSSTCEGINIAIANHVGRRMASAATIRSDLGQQNKSADSHSPLATKCLHYNRHKFANKKYHSMKDPERSLLWTFVRHPRARDISHVFFTHVSRLGIKPNNTKVLLKAIKSQRARQSRYLSLSDYNLFNGRQPYSKRLAARLATTLQQQVFEQYDFIGITERMHESLAVMTLLWELDPTDVIVLSAKQAGNSDSYDDGGNLKKCSKLRKPILHPVLADYFNSSLYLDGNPDYLLYYAANLSLDWTIHSLGVKLVQERSALLEQLEKLAHDTCYDKAIFPCSKDGVFQEEISNCYVQDAGCGYQCVDQLMEDYRQGKVVLS